MRAIRPGAAALIDRKRSTQRASAARHIGLRVIDRYAATQQRPGLSGSAVVRQWPQQGVVALVEGENLVADRAVRYALNQVIAERVQRSIAVVGHRREAWYWWKLPAIRVFWNCTIEVWLM